MESLSPSKRALNLLVDLGSLRTDRFKYSKYYKRKGVIAKSPNKESEAI